MLGADLVSVAGGICGSCQFSNDSTAKGCKIKLYNVEHTFCFDISRQTRDILLLKCFEVQTQGVFHVEIYEVPDDGEMGYTIILKLPDAVISQSIVLKLP